jgi:hypothetical protein
MQIPLCRHCGYGGRAAVITEMVRHNLNCITGSNAMEAVFFRYARHVPPTRILLQRNGLHALRWFRLRYRQMRDLPSPGISPLRLLFTTELGYPGLPASHAHLKAISFYNYIAWDKKRMLAELEEGGIDVAALTHMHSDCLLSAIVDGLMRSAWSVGKKEMQLCCRVRDGRLSKEEAMEGIKAIRARKRPDVAILRDLGLRDDEIEGMFQVAPARN